MIDFTVGDLVHIPQGSGIAKLLTPNGFLVRYGNTKNPCMGVFLARQLTDWESEIFSRATHVAKIYFIGGNYPNKIAYVETKNIYKLKRRNNASKNDTNYQ